MQIVKADNRNLGRIKVCVELTTVCISDTVPFRKIKFCLSFPLTAFKFFSVVRTHDYIKDTGWFLFESLGNIKMQSAFRFELCALCFAELY